jgi:hypothetical protein
MTLEELKAKALKQQELTGRKDADVMLVLPQRWKHQKKMRLLGKGGGPEGEPVSDVGDLTGCFFKADVLLAWIESIEREEHEKG